MADSSVTASPESSTAGELRIGLIGYGSIGGALAQCFDATRPPSARIVAVLTRTPRANLAPGMSVRSLDDLLEADPQVVVECAGQAAVTEHVPTLLRRGKEVVIASIGALADEDLVAAVKAAAKEGGGRLFIASGAVAALDGLAAARLIGIDTVTYRQCAPVTSWRGHPSAPADLESPGVHLIFSGSARDAARIFPKNANVTAAIALAGIGLQRTCVELVSDSSLDKNRHEISAEGAFGSLHMEIAAEPIAPGIRSSRLVAGSLLHVALRRGSSIVV